MLTVLQVLDAFVLYLELEGIHEERGVVEDCDGRNVDGCHDLVVSNAKHTEGWHHPTQGATAPCLNASCQVMHMPHFCHWLVCDAVLQVQVHCVNLQTDCDQANAEPPTVT